MPKDSGAAWRYRIYDIDYITHVFDALIFLNGADTFVGGKTYHQLISRTAEYVVPNGSEPPVISFDASYPDLYYGAIREDSKKVYSLNAAGGGETLMFDFNATIGDSIPSYGGQDLVTGIDSIMLEGVYHKRFLTNNPDYYVVEGVGSSEGLFPNLNDGGSDIVFYCFTDSLINYSPDSNKPCTYIYPINHSVAVPVTNNPDAQIKIFHVPAVDILHIVCIGFKVGSKACITNYLGQVVWSGEFEDKLDICIASWPKGIYSFRLNNKGSLIKVINFILK